jgi:hypothetical protein
MAFALAADDIRSLIKRHTRSAGVERRGENRKYLRLELTATILTMSRLPQIQIITDDLSPNGIGFTSFWAFSERELFMVPMRLAAHVEMLTLCEVMSSQALRNGECRTGARFIDSITTEKQIPIPDQWIDMATKGM